MFTALMCFLHIFPWGKKKKGGGGEGKKKKKKVKVVVRFFFFFWQFMLKFYSKSYICQDSQIIPEHLTLKYLDKLFCNMLFS